MGVDPGAGPSGTLTAGAFRACAVSSLTTFSGWLGGGGAGCADALPFSGLGVPNPAGPCGVLGAPGAAPARGFHGRSRVAAGFFGMFGLSFPAGGFAPGQVGS